MKTEMKLLIERQQAGHKLSMDEIHALMSFGLNLLKEFQALTRASIAHAQSMIREQQRKAA